jgi:arylsulfatase A-like enzyme
VSKKTLTRKDFLKVAGAGAVGATLIGTSALASGCSSLQRNWGEGTNVVLVIIDSLRKDHLGAYGNPWIRTPNLDALAKESLRFERAYPESLPTICARRAIHTGMRTWPFRDRRRYKGVDIPIWGWEPIPRDQTHLAEILKENGYQTLMVTDNLHQYKPSMNFQLGFDVFDYIRGQTTDGYAPAWTAPQEKVRGALGLSDYFEQYFANTSYRETEEDWFAPQVFTRAAQMLEVVSEGPPFFMVVDCYDPHPPNDPPDKYTSLYDDPYDAPEPYSPVQGPSDYLTERQLQRIRALYAGETTMMDRWLGTFLDKMEELGLFENTLLVLLSDHGVGFGEHGIAGKPHYALWPEVTDVPFLIRHPGGEGAGDTSDHFASTHDVAPTVLGFLGVEPEQPMDGQDLSVLLGGEEPDPRPHFTLGYHDYVWTRDERYAMFCRNDRENTKLFDVQRDPEMRKDIAAGYPDVVGRMFDEYVLGDAGGPLPVYDA